MQQNGLLSFLNAIAASRKIDVKRDFYRHPSFSCKVTKKQIVTLAIAEVLHELRFRLICLITDVPYWLSCTSQNVGGL